MIFLSLICIFAGVAAIVGTINMLNNKPTESISLKKFMPGNLPIITLSNNNNTFNFILDSGSNISHICKECYATLQDSTIENYKQSQVIGLGGISQGMPMCTVQLEDSLGNNYEVNLMISADFSKVAEQVEQSTGVKIHGLLGTDFLLRNNYVLDFKSLEVTKK